jgi:penicillin amidase
MRSYRRSLALAFTLAPVLVALGACGGDDDQSYSRPGADGGSSTDASGDAGDATTPDGAVSDAGADGAVLGDGSAGSGDAGDAGDAGLVIQGTAGAITIPGLTAPVSVSYDANGFLHISAKTDNDAFATLGYFHAANRFFFMDFIRSAIRGTLGARLPTSDVLAQDLSSRTFFADPKTGNPLADVLYGQLDDASKQVFIRYAAGVNAWLADMAAGRNGATLTSEYAVFSTAIPAWDPADCFAVALYSLNDLSNTAEDEIQLGTIAGTIAAFEGSGSAPLANVGGVLASLFLDFRSTYDVDAIEEANGQLALGTAPHKKSGRLARAGTGNLLAMANRTMQALSGHTGHHDVGDTGSNNWVISGTNTVSGKPLLANDPHLQLTNPSIWFPVEIDGKTGGTGTYHAAGGSFPGVPTIQTGHNETLAWGVTVSYWDLTDVYLEKLSVVPSAVSPGAVTFGAQTVPLVTQQVTFMQKGVAVPQTLLWVPHHGPVVSLDATAKTAATIRWRGHDGSTDVQAFLGMGRAATIADAKTALANITTANQNFVVADTTGAIAYFPFSQVPLRPWASQTVSGANPMFPLDGSSGLYEWGAPVATANMPQVTNPVKGFVATANGDISGDFRHGTPLSANPALLPIQSFAHAEGTREERIIESINATGTGNSPATIQALQGDTTSLPAREIVPQMMLAAAATPAGGFDPTNAATASVIAALTAWQTAGLYTCPSGIDGLDATLGTKTADATVAREAVACAAFHVALYALFDGAWGDEFAAANKANPALGLSSTASYTNNEIPSLVRAMKTTGTEPFWADLRVTDHTTTRTEILQRALTRAGSILSTQVGASSDDWRWGRFHTDTFHSLLSGTTAFDGPTYPTPGGLYTVNVANPTNVTLDSTPLLAQYTATSGPSIRSLIDLSSGTPQMKVMLPGGADLHRNGTFYENLAPKWLSDTPVDFPFGAGAVTAPAASITVTPG